MLRTMLQTHILHTQYQRHKVLTQQSIPAVRQLLLQLQQGCAAQVRMSKMA